MEKRDECSELEKACGASHEQVMGVLQKLSGRAAEMFEKLEEEAQPLMKDLFSGATPEAAVDPEHEAHGAAISAWLAVSYALGRRLHPAMVLGTALAGRTLADRVRFSGDPPEATQGPASA